MGEDCCRNIFETMLMQWQSVGYFTARRIVAYVALIKANASMDSLVEREDVEPEVGALKRYEKRYHDLQHGEGKRRVSNKIRVSASDPDATMFYRKGTDGGLKYTIHYNADIDTRIITECHTTTGSTQ